MSAVLCLPACLCVSAAASRGQDPLPMVWTHLPRRLQRQLLPVSQWPPVLRRAGMRQTIAILYPLRERMWMFLGMQP